MERILHMLNEWTWGVPMLVLMLASGLTFTLATRFVQFRRFGTVMKTSVCSVFSHPDQPGALSPFQAVATALAATVGTGNIAGVAGAIALGGPGAMFWMWVSALLGMATKYAEVLLSVHFRQRNSRGEWVGGPMYTILNGLGSRWKPLAMLFAALGAASAFGIGNMAQINTVTSVITGVVISLDPAAIGVRTPIARTVGILALFFCALVLLGGTQRIGKCTELLVPLMSAAYICATLWILITNAPMLKTVLVRIFQGAFKPESVIGGAAGIGIRQTIRLGIGRGVFSNEAGLGSAPIAYAYRRDRRSRSSGIDGDLRGICGHPCAQHAHRALHSGKPRFHSLRPGSRRRSDAARLFCNLRRHRRRNHFGRRNDAVCPLDDLELVPVRPALCGIPLRRKGAHSLSFLLSSCDPSRLGDGIGRGMDVIRPAQRLDGAFQLAFHPAFAQNRRSPQRALCLDARFPRGPKSPKGTSNTQNFAHSRSPFPGKGSLALRLSAPDQPSFARRSNAENRSLS